VHPFFFFIVVLQYSSRGFCSFIPKADHLGFKTRLYEEA